MSGSRNLSLAVAIALTAAVLAGPAPAARAEASLSVGPSIEVNGIVLSGAESFLEAGTTYVPLRAVSAALGAELRWSQEAWAVEAVLGSERVHLFVGTPLATVNGEMVPLASPPRLVGGRTYVPLRFVAEAFGATVGWDQEAYRVMITPAAEDTPGEGTTGEGTTGEGTTAGNTTDAAPDFAAMLAEARQAEADPTVRLVRYRTLLLAGYAGDAAFYLELGQAYVGAGDPAGAETAYRQAIALAPGSPLPYRDLRALLHAAGRHAEAAALYAEAEANAGADARWVGHFRYGRAIALAEAGRYDDAIYWLRQAVQVDASRYAQAESARAYIGRRRAGAPEMGMEAAAQTYADHQGQVVQVVGKVRAMLDDYTFQLGAGGESLVVQTLRPMAFAPGDAVAVTGTLHGSFTGYNIYGDAVTLGRMVDARVAAPGTWDLELDFE